MTIRGGTHGDAEEVLALICAIPELPQWNRESLALGSPDAEHASGPVRRLFVAEDQGRLIGFAQIGFLLGEAELESMAVQPAWRGRGVGRLLLQHAIAAARYEGATILRLELRQSNHAAFRLYTSVGMIAAGMRRGYYSNPTEDAVVMQCSWARNG